jgi:ribonucleoside-diphosphate reductase alpha chain
MTMTRTRLPNRRLAESFELRHRNHGCVYHVTIGRYADGSIGEVFIDVPGKVGSEIEAMARDFAVMLSIATQYGAPLDVTRHALTREQDSSPSTLFGALCRGRADQ